MDRAIREGDWEPWLCYMDELGRCYAEADVPFGTWFRVGEDYRSAMGHLLRHASGKDAREILAANLGMNRYLAIAAAVLGDAYVRAKEAIIKNQQEAYRALSTPILKVRDSLLVVPLIGLLDDERMAKLKKQLLARVQSDHARALVLDLTGVAEIPPRVGEQLLQLIEAARFLGAAVFISGISFPLSRALSDLPIERVAEGIAGDLGAGIEQANELLRLPSRIHSLPKRKVA
jgi:rsbT co-antagonist protein RsbR